MINYYLLTKPGIILGNLLTFFAGFVIASQGKTFQLGLFFATLTGLALIMASACVFNNYIDRHLDQKMQRTRNRALASGKIFAGNAIVFAVLLGFSGSLLLILFSNLLAFTVAAMGFLVYVFIYSLWKSRTVYGTAIGSIAGAVPPVVGYCAVSHQLDWGALFLFLMLVLWQMPHFFAIALYNYQDYQSAAIPVLPIKKGIFRTKIHMTFYILLFTLVAMLLVNLNQKEIYLKVTMLLGIVWMALGLIGFFRRDDQQWGRQMFYLSLFIILTISLAIPLELIWV